MGVSIAGPSSSSSGSIPGFELVGLNTLAGAGIVAVLGGATLLGSQLLSRDTAAQAEQEEAERLEAEAAAEREANTAKALEVMKSRTLEEVEPVAIIEEEPEGSAIVDAAATESGTTAAPEEPEDSAPVDATVSESETAATEKEIVTPTEAVAEDEVAAIDEEESEVVVISSTDDIEVLPPEGETEASKADDSTPQK